VVVGGAGVLIGALLGGGLGCPPVGGSEGRVRGTGGGCVLIGALTSEDVGGAA